MLPLVAGRRRTVAAGLTGFVGMAMVVLGAAQPGSPFTSKLPGAWIFGIPPAGSGPVRHVVLGMALVYAGMIAVLSAWYWMVTRPAPAPGTATVPLYAVLALWVAPLVVAPPLFSRDVYTYGAEGRLVSRGVDPYTHGLQAVRGSTFFALADPLWRHARAPYGPVFFDVARVVAPLRTVFATVEGYRLVALVGVVLLAVSIPVLARSEGRDPSVAFCLAVLNPLVLLCFVGGLHNDALMVGLLVAGLALARRGHPVLGVVLCALGAQVKAPCFLGVVLIGWEWAGTRPSARRRVWSLGVAVLVALAVMAVVSEVSGLGWAWLWNLSDPGKVDSWLDPATAVGLALSHVVAFFAAGAPTHALVVAARVVALLVAAVIVCVLVGRTDRYGMPRALGYSLLAVVFLGPVVWPWYETWGLVLLALAHDVWSRRVVLVLSAVGCFATVPAYVTASATDVAVAVAALVVVLGAAGLSLSRARRAMAGTAAGGGPS